MIQFIINRIEQSISTNKSQEKSIIHLGQTWKEEKWIVTENPHETRSSHVKILPIINTVNWKQGSWRRVATWRKKKSKRGFWIWKNKEKWFSTLRGKGRESVARDERDCEGTTAQEWRRGEIVKILTRVWLFIPLSLDNYKSTPQQKILFMNTTKQVLFKSLDYLNFFKIIP